jgi:hypothetical protein
MFEICDHILLLRECKGRGNIKKFKNSKLGHFVKVKGALLILIPLSLCVKMWFTQIFAGHDRWWSLRCDDVAASSGVL